MCGRYTLRTPADAVLDHFQLGAAAPLQLALRFNIAPMQDAPVVRWQRTPVELAESADATLESPESTGQRELAGLRWGLVPFWAADPKGGARMINARSETVASKPAFRAAFKRRRCLVPSDGYIEWETRGKQKLPHYIQMQDERLFAYAGLWESWGKRETGNRLDTFTILTTDANDLTSSVHDRMPVILNEADYDMWLDPDFNVVEPLQELLRPYPGDEMKMRRVSTRVNNVRNDDPECLESPQELF
ncbi:MAG: SOS response-associated peptidase [Planctomycetales bacterium]|nr:SOS response-associated peptidase [Planctomycetales bacterium]